MAGDPFGVCFPDAIKKWAQFVIVIIAKKPPCRKAFPLVFRGIFILIVWVIFPRNGAGSNMNTRCCVFSGGKEKRWKKEKKMVDKEKNFRL